MKIIAHTASALSRLRDDALAAGCVDFIPKPIRAERLYECLQTHLGVEFVCDEALPQRAENAADELHRVTLPEELSARLMVGAELHSTTALKNCLQELRALGPDAAKLADEIRHLMSSYDMDGIQRLLARVTAHEPVV